MLHDWNFFHCCQRHLSDDGVMALNLLTDDIELFRDITMHVMECFNFLSLCLKVPEHKNIIVFGFKKLPTHKGRAELQQIAKQLSQRYEVDFNSLVNHLFNSNPLEDDELIISPLIDQYG
jgi:spermidine synthase